MARKYGMPYQGSKGRIAEWVADVLPRSHTLVDLFAGGCAVTHAALLSGKWERIIANDKTDSAVVFCAAINGEFDGYAACPSREEWKAYREMDTALALLHSFGNDKTTYLWGDGLEAVKRPASLMVSAPSLWERYKWYHRFIDALADYLETDGNGRLTELEGVERLVQVERVTKLQELRGLQGLSCLQGDYRLVEIPKGATVYADPPYRGTDNRGHEVRGKFDFEAFDMWLGGVDFPVYVSEYNAPEGCVEIARTNRVTTMAANSTGARTERIFVQERFADQYQPDQLTLFTGEVVEQ